VEDDGESWSGRAGGVDRRMLRKLRAGSVPVEAELDLHGLTRAAAAPALERFLAAARAAGRRCLLVIHGRGLHSEGGSAALRPVVRQALIGGASAGAVLAFTSAPPALGGSGATLIYLRRP
jgi:DNA-nicking Smr family endonuclease